MQLFIKNSDSLTTTKQICVTPRSQIWFLVQQALWHIQSHGQVKIITSWLHFHLTDPSCTANSPGNTLAPPSCTSAVSVTTLSPISSPYTSLLQQTEDQIPASLGPFLNLGPPLLDQEDYLLGLGDDQGISDLFEAYDFDKIPSCLDDLLCS